MVLWPHVYARAVYVPSGEESDEVQLRCVMIPAHRLSLPCFCATLMGAEADENVRHSAVPDWVFCVVQHSSHVAGLALVRK